MAIAADLARHIEQSSYNSLPAAAIHAAKRDELLGKLRSCLEAGGYGSDGRLAELVWTSVMELDKEPYVGAWMDRLSNMLTVL